VRPFEEAVAAELAGLLRAGVPLRGISITVREMLVTRLERGPLGPREVSEAIGAQRAIESDAAISEDSRCHVARGRSLRERF